MAQNLVGENVRRIRIARGWSQRELADAAQTTGVAMIESGKRPNARTETLQRIAQALGVDLSDLYRAPRPPSRAHVAKGGPAKPVAQPTRTRSAGASR